MEGRDATWGVGGVERRRGRHVVRTVAETGSTNADLLAAAAAGAPDGAVLVARHQTAGRGRLDRRWDAPPGRNLLASILWRDPVGPPQTTSQRVALAAGVACGRIAGVTPDLKWPNDLLLDGRKLAGVLAQAGTTRWRIDHVVVGIGVNVGWAPPGAAQLPSGSPDELLDALLDALAELDRDAPDPVSLAALYRASLSTIGRDVRVELPGGADLTGVALDVDEAGRLVVGTGSGDAVVLDVGDVIHIRPVPR